MIGTNLICLRKKSGKTQQEVAHFFHITRQALSNYELGKRNPDSDMLLQLSDYFGVTVDDLLRLSPEQLLSKIKESDADAAKSR